MSLLIAFVLISVAISFLCSLLEAALLSVTPSYIAQLKQEGSSRYAGLHKLKNRIDQPLAAILTLNTIAHTGGAAGVGAQVTVLFGDGYLGLASAVMTLVILIFSEIIPKTIGARYWVSLAPFLPPVLNPMIVLLKPFIWLSDHITSWLGARPQRLDLRAEIKALTSLGREMDELDQDEQRVIANILDLHDIRARDIMTPRTVCEYVSTTTSVAEMIELSRRDQFSRYPVLDDEGHPHGVVFRFDLVEADPAQQVSELMKPVKIITDSESVENILSSLLKEHQHMCLVYDEYGTWLGLLTMEDIIETILGQPIMDETDDIPNMRRFARRRWEHRMKHM
ncbi:MAG: hemolysin family protein [Gammaproteobacteria bacterium]